MTITVRIKKLDVDLAVQIPLLMMTPLESVWCAVEYDENGVVMGALDVMATAKPESLNLFKEFVHNACQDKGWVFDETPDAPVDSWVADDAQHFIKLTETNLRIMAAAAGTGRAIEYARERRDIAARRAETHTPLSENNQLWLDVADTVMSQAAQLVRTEGV
jgi:hypothetical protein